MAIFKHTSAVTGSLCAPPMLNSLYAIKKHKVGYVYLPLKLCFTGLAENTFLWPLVLFESSIFTFTPAQDFMPPFQGLSIFLILAFHIGSFASQFLEHILGLVWSLALSTTRVVPVHGVWFFHWKLTYLF